MPAAKAFFDSNILLYLLSGDAVKADRAERLVSAGGFISVQVLNEITNVMRRKLAMPWQDIDEFMDAIRVACDIQPLTVETHDAGRRLSQRYGLSVYDAMICASAQLSDCKLLYSEDMQVGLVIERSLRVRNPFLS
jgi:predicted nucleic acid-binding protein